MWDLLSKAEIILRNEPDSPWLPLLRQGQGIQSLSVIFLFQAFVEHLMRELYEQESEPVLALEEPETHLHPQAARTLWDHIRALPGQKIAATHSPYFVQHVPFRDLRLVRLTKDGTQVKSLPASFSAPMPEIDGLQEVIGQSDGRLTYDAASETLTVYGPFEEKTFRALLACCGKYDRRNELEGALRDLRDRCALYIDDEELGSLETYARRMRGEVFFAERWLIVEGQADYLIVHALASALNYDLDSHGVSVIDAQNNGHPATFAALARALEIPWLGVFDGDDAGKEYVNVIGKRGFNEDELARRCQTHRAGDLEHELLADGLGAELRAVLTGLGVAGAAELEDNEVETALRRQKTAYAAALSEVLRTNPDLAQRTLPMFRWAIEQLPGLK